MEGILHLLMSWGGLNLEGLIHFRILQYLIILQYCQIFHYVYTIIFLAYHTMSQY